MKRGIEIYGQTGKVLNEGGDVKLFASLIAPQSE